MKEQSEVGNQNNEATAILNMDREIVTANDAALEVHGCREKEIIGKCFEQLLVEPSVEHGQAFEKMKQEKFSQSGVEAERQDGKVIIMDITGIPIVHDGEKCVQISVDEVRETESSGTKDSLDASDFDDINAARLEQIVQNTRVDAPSGEMPLNAIMLDLAVGHNELEQYKQGALSLHDALDERLQEEEKRNPDSDVCDVLREVKKAAFGLYLRLQRGDAELTGERNGKYSNYFN